MNETALKPRKMRIDIYGSGEYNGGSRPFPSQYIEDALSQNILYHCYEKPQDIESLAKLCGVPAYYIEDRIDNLVKRNAVISQGKGRYQTDFIIWTDKYGEFCDKNAESYISPVADRLVSAFEALFERADRIPIYRAEKSADELHFLYGVMAFDFINKTFSRIRYPQIPQNYDGFRWRYIANMETGRFRRINVGQQVCANTDTSYSHHSFRLKDFKGRNMMCSSDIRACESLLDPNVSCDENSAVSAVQSGYIIRKDNGELLVTPPAFTKEQKSEFDSIVRELFEPLADEYISCVERFTEGYKKLFPRHLADDAQRMCSNMVFNFFEVIMGECRKKGTLPEPDSEWICDVLLQTNRNG